MKSNIESNNMQMTGKAQFFYKIGDSYFIQSKCIFAENKRLTVNVVYDILDFLDGGGIHSRRIKLLCVYLKGFIFSICGIDIDNGEFVSRHSRLGYDDVICSWVICELFYFDKIPDEKAIRAYCERNKACLSKTSKGDDLLELGEGGKS